MSKKYDVYIKDGKALVYQRGDVDEYGCLPDTKPLREMQEDEEWYDWCMEDCGWKAEDDTVRVCRLSLSICAEFAKDLLDKAQRLLDAYRSRGKALGWGNLAIDKSWTVHTFRSSANWKEEPVRYTFDQRLKWENPPSSFADTEALFTRDKYVMLVGMADAVHELGLDIVFDSEFKIYVMGARETWATKYEF